MREGGLCSHLCNLPETNRNATQRHSVTLASACSSAVTANSTPQTNDLGYSIITQGKYTERSHRRQTHHAELYEDQRKYKSARGIDLNKENRQGNHFHYHHNLKLHTCTTADICSLRPAVLSCEKSSTKAKASQVTGCNNLTSAFQTPHHPRGSPWSPPAC